MKKSTGLLALLGLGALAYYRYTKMSPEQKEKVKGQVDDAKQKLNKASKDLKGKVDESFAQLKEEVDTLKNRTEHYTKEMNKEVDNMYN